jgi:hypothetical protein
MSVVQTSVTYVRFQVLTAASMNFRVFWDVAPCSQIDVDGRQYIAEDSELHSVTYVRTGSKI